MLLLSEFVIVLSYMREEPIEKKNFPFSFFAPFTGPKDFCVVISHHIFMILFVVIVVAFVSTFPGPCCSC